MPHLTDLEYHALVDYAKLRNLDISRIDRSSPEFGSCIEHKNIRYYLPSETFLDTSALYSAIKVNNDLELSHFVPAEYSYNMLDNGEIFLKSISMQSDLLELEHCYAEAFAVTPLQRLKTPFNGEWNTARATGKDLRIFCLTETSLLKAHSDKFWQTYAGGNYQGVRIDFVLRAKVPVTLPLWTTGFTFGNSANSNSRLYIGRVAYDNGQKLDAYKELRTSLLKVGTETIFHGFSAVSCRYKREKFQWENEVRIVLDTSGDSNAIRNGNEIEYRKQVDEKESAAVHGIGARFESEGAFVKFDNSQFELEVVKVTCGSNAHHSVVNSLRVLCSNKHVLFDA